MKALGTIKKQITASHLFNAATSQLHYRQRRKELYGIAGDLTEKFKKQPAEPEKKDAVYSKYIWVCWWQGEEKMTPLVKSCYKNILKWNPDKQVILITEDNLAQYVTFPDYIMKKYHCGIITPTHFSDLLRMELLYHYGGVWMDITIMTWSAIPSRFYDTPVYTGRFPRNKKDYNISRNRWTSFFWVARHPGNVLFQFMSEFWRRYWSVKDELIEYFLIDYALDFACHFIPSIRRELELVPENGCGEDVWKLLKLLPEDYDNAQVEKIIQTNWMQKLSYKGEDHIQEKASNPENSVYRRLCLIEQ